MHFGFVVYPVADQRDFAGALHLEQPHPDQIPLSLQSQHHRRNHLSKYGQRLPLLLKDMCTYCQIPHRHQMYLKIHSLSRLVDWLRLDVEEGHYRPSFSLQDLCPCW